MPLPYFSRSQLGVILLLGAALLGLYAWRAQVIFPPAPPPPGLLPLAFVEVTGKVAHPGVYSFSEPPTLGDLWQRAGGPGTAPDQDKKIASGSRVEVTPAGSYRLAAMSGAKLLTLGLPINLNRACATDLAAVPGLGPALAQRIVTYRQAHGPFKKMDDLAEVSGITPRSLAKLKPYLGLGGPEPLMPRDWQAAMTSSKPTSETLLEGQAGSGSRPGSPRDRQAKNSGRRIDPNLASQKDLEALPGIGPVLAHRIIAYRRTHGPFKKITDLRKVSGIGPKKLERMRPYLSIHKTATRN
jgi:competence protein ComEA